ncbi:hypothetical protein HHO41_04795 [Bacillus sp. DNRA2]|uniref:hypothetical protein n=1 Tax=Bacillus sp. DNRA2 TaxID=2723053 RepID=UPI00145E1F02|nr:hypothetical protein [Bacillus sp. DNRA2]NMD69598.1 hypothetical protein [Bacillus sp. DNRA2]
MRQQAYLLDGTICLSITDVCETIEHMATDWAKSSYNKATYEIIKGTFSGYVNDNNCPVGMFAADDGREFIANEDDEVIELEMALLL